MIGVFQKIMKLFHMHMQRMTVENMKASSNMSIVELHSMLVIVIEKKN